MSKMSFESYLHPEFLKFYQGLQDQGCLPMLVGGTVRDYFLNMPNKHDYDLEVRFVGEGKYLTELLDKLSFDSNLKKEILPFNIIKLTHNDFSCELSLPRLEKFNDEFHHKNFEVEFIADLEYKAGFFRRDFTINAMGMLKDKDWDLIDPLNGKKDLDNKILRACSEDFFKDPVRFLRAIRFQVLFGFKLDVKIQTELDRLSFEDFPTSYLVSEAKKSGHPLDFYFELFKEQLDKESDNRLDHFLDLHSPLIDYKDHLDKLNFLPLWFVNNLAKIHHKKEITKRKDEFPDVKALSSLDYQSLTKEQSEELLWLSRFLQWPKIYQDQCLIWFGADKKWDETEKVKSIEVDVSNIEPKLRAVYKMITQLKEVCS